MQWILILAGLALLLLAVILTFWIQRRTAHAVNAASPFCRPYRHVKLSRKPERLLQKAARLSADSQDVDALQASARILMEHILRIRERLRTSPALPSGEDDIPRLMKLAREIVDEERYSADSMTDALSSWDEAPSTPAEVTALPLCTAVAQCERLTSVLEALLTDAQERQRALHLARRLPRSKHVLADVEKADFSPCGMAALLTELRTKEQHELLAALDEWLSAHSASAEELALLATKRKVRLAEEVRRALDCFDMLTRMDWRTRSEETDPIHQMLLKDPADVYRKMDVISREALRHQVERLCHKVRLDASEVIQRVIALSGEAEERSLEAHIGYWFQDVQGLRRLHDTLPTKRGWLYARLSLSQEKLKYTKLWGLGIAAGFLFLQGRQPVFMLPFFALVVGCAARRLFRRRSRNLPGMEVAAITENLRTLVVLPAALRNPHEAIRRVRQLKTARHAFPEEGVDFLLLGDFGDNMTAVSSSDAAIIHAASTAIAALQSDGRYLYIQRGRSWNGDRHTYCPRGGRRGAVTELCRLIAQGECEDVIAYATIEAAQLERQYAYVLVLPADRQPAPGMLTALLQRMTHPLCKRYPASEGWRGYAVLSPEGSAVFEGAGLIRPDAYLEATDGLVDPRLEADALCGELAGHADVPGARVESVGEDNSWDALYLRAQRAWKLSPWQLPYVQTPSGLVRNPLGFFSRFQLREQLRDTLVPLAQCALLLWAILTQSWLLLMLALLATEINALPRRWRDLIRLGCQLSLLPMRAVVNVRAVVDILRRGSGKAPQWPSLALWAQWVGATLVAALGLTLPQMIIPALALAGLFACYPLMQRLLADSMQSPHQVTDEHIALLEDTASRTWQFFRENVTEETQYLPPSTVQFEPDLGQATVTSPEAIGGYLLSCVCAKELGYISADAAAERIRKALEATAKLSLPFGLPCRLYALPSLTVQDARVDAAGVGFLLASLLTAAQALRTWLPEMSTKYEDLSGNAEDIAASFDLSALYDEEAGLFHAGLDENGQGAGYVDCFADAALLLSVAACARKHIPPEHFSRLSRTFISLHGNEIPLSRDGSATAHLLAGLFLPIADQAAGYIRVMVKRAQDGVFGQGASGYFTFDPALRYRTASFGIQEAAVDTISSGPVFAPYAAALCLPYEPRQASETLMKFQAHGAHGPLGFCDAVDFSQGIALVGMHDAFHQGMVLIAAAHILADAPIRRYFTGLPEVEACLPLLEPHGKQLLLPVMPVHARSTNSPALAERAADTLSAPANALLMGTPEFHMIADAWGNSSICDESIPLIHTNPDAPVSGIQFYLADEGRVYRIGDPNLPGQAVFAPGEVRYEQLCGSLKAELVCTVDTVRRRALHVLTITNLSTRDRVIEAADCLLPDLGVPQNTLEATHPSKGRLVLHARDTDRELHHTAAASTPALSVSACTDALDFTGRGRTLLHPASLEVAPHDLVESSAEPCLSFRLKLALGGRGQATLWFTTSMAETAAPHLTEITGIRRLAALQHAAIDEAIPLTEVQAQATQLMAGLILDKGSRIGLILKTAAGLDILSDAVAVAGWFMLHGMRVQLDVACPPDICAHAQEDIQGQPAEELVRFVEEAETAHCPIFLHGDSPLLAQLEAMHSRLPVNETSPKPPIPALLPKMELIHQGNCGGFSQESCEYVIQLAPGQTTPAPWTNRHVSRYFREQVDESGFREPFGEQVLLKMADGTELSPWSVALPRTVSMGAGTTVWEAWSDKLDLRLCASALPGHRCGLRALRVRNATDEPLTARVIVLAQLEDRHADLECAPGIVMTAIPNGHLHAYLAGSNWTAYQTKRKAPYDPPLESDGRYARLECTLELQPHATGEALWLAGHARHAEEVAQALFALDESGASALLRAVRAEWAQRLNKLTVSTPEDSLDRLMNHILPVQAISAEGTAGLPVTIHLAPREAKRTLLQAARHAQTRDEWAHLALYTAAYVRVTNDHSVLDVHLVNRENTLYECCARELLTLPKDHQGLPLGNEQAKQSMLYAEAAQVLDGLRTNAELQEFARKLLNAADTYLWQEGYYGEPLRLDVQHLACAAYSSTPRTRQAIRTAWLTLYDRPHGLIRQHEVQEVPPLPGLPENGGMITLDAVFCLHSLMMTDHTDEAHELLQALNPLHHTDDPLRAEVFRCAPYHLHGGMYAAPLEAGRAVPKGGDEAAGLLYAVVLQDVLGFHREGSVIRMKPLVPPDWEDYTLTLREGASTWHISVERRVKALTIDGDETGGDEFTVKDDGRVHQIRIPLK